MLDVTVSFLFELAMAGSGVVAAFAVARYRVNTAEEKIKEQSLHITALDASFQEFKLQSTREFQEFQLQAAREFVTSGMLRDFKEEIKSSVDRLTNRLDQVLSKRSRGAS